VSDGTRDIYPAAPVVDGNVWLVPALEVHGPPTTGRAVGSAVVLASADAGTRWQQVYTQSHSPEGVYGEGIDHRPAGIRDAIRFGDRFIAVGSTGNGSAPIWIGAWE
jgi:hypothetical protein